MTKKRGAGQEKQSNQSKKIILSLGGSIIFPEEIDTEFIKKFKGLILELLPAGYEFIIITGGGKICRKYQAAAKELNPDIDSIKLDLLGIETTKLNAYFMKQAFKEHAMPEIITDPTKKIPAKNLGKHKIKYKIIFGAGWKPGCSTDKDAVLLAKTMGIKTVINASNIEYIYDNDPNKNPDAKKIERMSWQEFKKMFGTTWRPGANYPFDPIAGKIAAENKMKVIILDGRDLENLKKCIEGKEFKGTRIE